MARTKQRTHRKRRVPYDWKPSSSDSLDSSDEDLPLSQRCGLPGPSRPPAIEPQSQFQWSLPEAQGALRPRKSGGKTLRRLRPRFHRDDDVERAPLTHISDATTWAPTRSSDLWRLVKPSRVCVRAGGASKHGTPTRRTRRARTSLNILRAAGQTRRSCRRIQPQSRHRPRGPCWTSSPRTPSA